MITINLQSPPLKLLLTILLLLLIIPQTTLSKSGIYTESRAFCHNTNTTEPGTKTVLLKYKAGSVAAILVCGGIGVTLPLLGHKIPALKPENDVFFMIKAFAAGVILATSFIHILPEAFRDLTSPCLVEISSIFGSFPFAGFVAMCSSIGTLMVDSFATGFCKRQQRKQIVDADDVERSGDGDDHLHVRVSVSAVGNRDLSSSEIIRRRIVSQVLELGILVHSLVIGISLGASNTVEVIKPLLVALSFHQFFEGLGLGGCIAQAKFKSKSTAIMAVFFSLTTPIGIGIGMAISRIYRENSSTAILVEGILNSTSSGILIYMALVDLLAADFMNPKLLNNFRILLGANVSLVLGASCMSVLAIWT